MTKRIKMRMAAIMLAVVSLVTFSATGAWAFYTSGGCSATGITMNVTNYSKGSGQEYHIYAKSTNTSQYRFIKVFLAGSQVASGNYSVETYQYKSNPTANYTATAVIYDNDPDGGSRQCSYVS